MTSSIRHGVVVFIGLFCGVGSALAQSIGPVEAIAPNGAVTQSLAFSPAQRRAIYNAVVQQRVRTASSGLAAAVGAPVPPSVALRDLPDQAAIDNSLAGLLKYAVVEGDVVVVDPIGMRVVDVIRRIPE
jgi:hypothetical protein